MGELQPRHGIFVFQATLSVSLQVSGSAGSSATTPACGPRNWGHWSVADTPVSASRATPTTIAARVIISPLFLVIFLQAQSLYAISNSWHVHASTPRRGRLEQDA